MIITRAALGLGALSAVLVACSSASSGGNGASASGAITGTDDGACPTGPPSPGDAGAPDASSGNSGPTASDGASAPDGGAVACTSTFGDALPTLAHGRLDGRLVAVVPTTTPAQTCNADPRHLHLQVAMNDAVYDVALNLNVMVAELDAPLPGTVYQEGFHANEDLDYVADLGAHDSAFTDSTAADLEQRLEVALAGGGPVAIYATAYSGGGADLVHRVAMTPDGGISTNVGQDGALFTNVAAEKPAHVFLFRFSYQSF